VDAGFLFMLVSAVALAIGKKELKKFKQPKNTRPLSARQTKTKLQNLTSTLRTKYLHGTSLNGRPKEHSTLRHDGQ
jgi:hypothetical protein